MHKDEMRAGKDTVACGDVLLPGIGEVVGGSQRETRLDILEEKMREVGLAVKDYQWYLDLRRFGSVTHSGYGLGVDRLIRYITDIAHIRDVVPVPVYYKGKLY